MNRSAKFPDGYGARLPGGGTALLRRRLEPAARRVALACLHFTASAVSVLLASDLFEFSWRYQLPALVTLAPGGALRSRRHRELVQDCQFRPPFLVIHRAPADPRRIFAAQGIRAFGYGFGAVLLGVALRQRGTRRLRSERCSPR